MVAYLLSAMVLGAILLLITSGVAEIRALLRSQRLLRLQQRMVDRLVGLADKPEAGPAVQRVLASGATDLFATGSLDKERR